MLAVVGDHGLAGSYNSGVLRATERLMAKYAADGVEAVLWTVGKKAPAYFRYRRIPVRSSSTGMADRPRVRRRA